MGLEHLRQPGRLVRCRAMVLFYSIGLTLVLLGLATQVYMETMPLIAGWYE